MVTAIGAAAVYFREAFQGIMDAMSGTIKRCPVCNDCFVSEKYVFLSHMISCGKTEPVEFYSFRQIDNEVKRIEGLMGMRQKEASKRQWGVGPKKIYFGSVTNRVLRDNEPLGQCPDPC